MEQQRVDMFVMTNQKYLPAEKMMILKERLTALDDDKFTLISSVEMKDPTTILLVSLFLGYLGIDRFMMGDTGLGILKLCTFGVCGVMTIVDWFLVMGKTKENNFNNLMMHL